MNLRQLEAFRTVIESGTVTRAPETLRISQPAVSKLIGHLARIITRFLGDHGDTRITIASRSGRMLVEWVAANQVDLGIGLLMLEHPGIAYQSAGSVDAVCVLDPKHPLARRKVIRARDLD